MQRITNWFSKPCSWLITGSVVVLLLIIFTITDALYWNWNYSGFGPKTLWDWMDLLIVPLVLAIGGYIYNRTEKQTERDQADRRNQTEREIAEDNQREAALQTYLDHMSELLLAEKGLRASQLDDEIRSVARARTLTVLRRLDATRKGSVLQFLHESNLITTGNTIVKLYKADLTDADLTDAYLYEAALIGINLMGATLTRANLEGADLLGANLSDADCIDANLMGAALEIAFLYNTDLTGADLLGAILKDADLTKADLTGADLTKADLTGATISEEQLASCASLKGATLPDGTKHP